MLGAIAGDIIGSVYEWGELKTKEFPLFRGDNSFTDDTVLTVAVADSILSNADYGSKLREYYHAYPAAGYGARFRQWAEGNDPAPYYSWGNGSAMRVSPVGYAYLTLAAVLDQAAASASVTHNHPEGIKGAQATAGAIFLARNKKTKAEIKDWVTITFGYQLDEPIAEIRKDYEFDQSCQGTVPAAIRAFLESTDFTDAIRNAISLGGDSDTLACITGGIAEAYYGEVPPTIAAEVYRILDDRLRQIVINFYKEFITK